MWFFVARACASAGPAVGVQQGCPGAGALPWAGAGQGGDRQPQVRAGPGPPGTAPLPAVCNSDIQWLWPYSQPGSAPPPS